jgi:hypothetical protein
VSVYAGALFGTYDDALVFPLGLTVRLGHGWSFTPQYEGHASHGWVSYTWSRYQVSTLLVRWRHPGLSINVGF